MASDPTYRLLFDRHPEPMWVTDTETCRFLAVNDAALRLYGHRRDDFLAIDARELRTPEGVEVELVSNELEWDGRPARVVCVHDVTRRVRLDRQLARRLAQQSALARLGERAVEARDPATLLLEIAPAIAGTLGVETALVLRAADGGFTVDAAHGLPLETGADVPVAPDGLVRRALAGRPQIAGDGFAEELAGEPLAAAAVVPIPGPRGARGVVLAGARRAHAFTVDDATFLQTVAAVLAQAEDRFVAEEQIRHRAFHDQLTGLPNRALLADRLTTALHRADRRTGAVAVLCVGLDGFKRVNDSHGHDVGDELLAAVTPRIREALRPPDTVARFGGDEFVVVCEVDDAARAVVIADRVGEAFARPFALPDGEHFVTASIGIAVSGGPEREAPELIRDADAAMHRAKEGGRARHELFDDAMRTRTLDRVRTENELRRALERGELCLHYQPIVGLPGGEVLGCEALVRWCHPTRGLVMPDEFIGVAEETGVIIPIGQWVLREAATEAVRWQAARPDEPPPWVSVNLSMREVSEPWLVQGVAETLEATGLPPASLLLEMTESVLLERDASIDAMEQLTALGVRLALDDFGTGWSSLAYVKRFPLDLLKIDRRFVAELGTPGGDRSIVEAIVRMAVGLRLGVVAEGVETELQRDELAALGCSTAQGYLFSRPTSGTEIRRLLGTRRPAGWHAA